MARGEELRPEASSGDAPSLSQAQLRAAVAPGSEAESRRRTRTMFSRLKVADIRRVQKQVEDLSLALSDEEEVEHAWILANELYRRWGELAPQEALEFLVDHDAYWSGLKAAVFFGWARSQPDESMKAYRPDMEGQYSSELENAVLEGLCEVDPAKALTFADARERGHAGIFDPEDRQEWYRRHHDSGLWDFLELVPTTTPADPFGRALHEWMRRDPNEALEAILEVKYEVLKHDALGALFANWVLIDADAALEAVGRVEDRDLRESALHLSMQAYLLHHPRKAFEQVVKIPPRARARDPFDGGFLADGSDDTLPYRFHRATPTRTFDRMDLVSEAGVALGFRDGRAAWDRALKLEDPAVRLAALGGVMAGWMLLDREQAMSFARKGIRDGFSERVPGDDYPGYAARLVGKMLAQSNLEMAIAWTESLPPGESRDGAVGVAADVALSVAWDKALAEASPEGWVDADAFLRIQQREYAPIEKWLISLPPSGGRDRGLSWLVFRLGDHDDVARTLGIITMIGDARLRGLDFESIARDLEDRKRGLKDKFDADQWCEDHPDHADELRKALREVGS